MNMMIDQNKEYKVEGYYNNWSIINSYKNYHLLENCVYGDETCYLVVDEKTLNLNKKYPTFMNVICETFDGILTALFDENLISEEEYEKEMSL